MLLASFCIEKAGRWQRPPFLCLSLYLPSMSARPVPLCISSGGGPTVTNNGTWEEFLLLILPPCKSVSSVRCLIAGPVRCRHFKQDDKLDRLLNNVQVVEPEPDLDSGLALVTRCQPLKREARARALHSSGWRQETTYCGELWRKVHWGRFCHLPSLYTQHLPVCIVISMCNFELVFL